MNKRVLESLAKAGALDSFGKRAEVFAALDKCMERAQKSQKDAAAGQHGLFGIFDEVPAGGGSAKEEALPAAPDWDEHTRLQNEKDVLGFFVSGHPMDKYREKLRNMKVVDTVTACEMKPEPVVFRRGQQEQGNEISIAGVITGLKVAIAFSSTYEKLVEKLKIDVPVVVRGTLRGEEDSAPKLSVSSIQALEDIKIRLPEALRIKVPLHSPDAALLEKLHAVFLSAPGSGRLMLRLEEPETFQVDLEPEGILVAADVLFIEQVEELVGRGAVQIVN
jgi:DNA polymerase-3 subunit alpha